MVVLYYVVHGRVYKVLIEGVFMPNRIDGIQQEIKVIQDSAYALFASGSDCLGGASKSDKAPKLKEKGVDPLVKVVFKISESLGTALATFAGQDAIALIEPQKGVLRFLDNENKTGEVVFVGACSDGMSIGTGAATLEENALTARILITQFVQAFSEQGGQKPEGLPDVFIKLFNSAVDKTFREKNPRRGETTLTLVAIARKQDGSRRVVVCGKGDSPAYVMGINQKGKFELIKFSREDTVAAKRMENAQGKDFVKNASAAQYEGALSAVQDQLGDLGAPLVADANQHIKLENVFVFGVPSSLQNPHLLYGSDCLEKLGDDLKRICETSLRNDPNTLPSEIMKALLAADADDNTFAVKKID